MIPGDGIGPEISEAVKTVFKAAQVPISWVEVDVKPILLPTGQTTIPQKAIDQIKQIKIGLKGKIRSFTSYGLILLNRTAGYTNWKRTCFFEFDA